MSNINIIGHLSSSSGLGNTARLFIDVFRGRGYQVSALDVGYHSGTSVKLQAELLLHKSIEDLPDGINLIILAVQLLPAVWIWQLPGLLNPRFKNVGLVFWELPVVPKAWYPSLQLFDAIMVCSHYVRHAVEIALPTVKTVFAEHPLQLPSITDDTSAVRARIGVKDTDLVVMSSFDLRSDFSRKNPMAVLDAFELAYRGKPDVKLVIKANGKPDARTVHPVVQKILSKIAQDSRMVLISDTLPYAQVMALYAACDVYISLHRAEGLGLGPMEAMALGKLAIATGYSGNMTYMTQQNSVPLPYTLTEPRKTAWQFKPSFAGVGAAWADVDMPAAVASLQMTYDNPAKRKQLAAAGQQDIQRRQETALAAPYLDELTAYFDGYRVPTNRQALRRKVAFKEVTDLTLCRLNAAALWSKFRQ